MKVYMKKSFYFILLTAVLSIPNTILADDCEKDTTDIRGKMQPWQKGAWETGSTATYFWRPDINNKISMQNLTKHIMMFLKDQIESI